MTAAPAAERSIPAPANQVNAGWEAVRSSLTNSSAPSAGMLQRSSPTPSPALPAPRESEEGTGTLGFLTLGCVRRPSCPLPQILPAH